MAVVCEMTASVLIKDLSAWVRDGTDHVIELKVSDAA
jgi:hypothetical protein